MSDLKNLQQAVTQGDLVIFIGAGISAAAGLPSWKQLVERLIDGAKKKGSSKADIQEIVDLASKNQFIDALSALKDTLGNGDFYNSIEQHLDDKNHEIPEVAHAIAQLAPHTRALLTTNIDHILERALGGRWPALFSATGDIAQRRHIILKTHGTLLDRSTWVFTRDDYARAMYADQRLQSAFSAIFHGRTLLFIGYGLADDDFDQLLARVRAFAGNQPPRHYALAPADQSTTYRRKRLESSGVTIITYQNKDGSHKELTKTIRLLTPNTDKPAASRPSRSPNKETGAVVMTERQLTEIEKAIGPMLKKDELELREAADLEFIFTCNWLRLVDEYAFHAFGATHKSRKRPYDNLKHMLVSRSDIIKHFKLVDDHIAPSPPVRSRPRTNAKRIPWDQYKLVGIKVSDKNHRFVERLKKHSQSPVLPTDYTRLIEKLLEHTHKNLVSIGTILNDCASEFPQKYPDLPSLSRASPMWAYNKYNDKLIDLKPTLNKISAFIKTHFRID